MEEEIQILFTNIRLLGIDLDQLQKQYRVKVNT